MVNFAVRSVVAASVVAMVSACDVVGPSYDGTLPAWWDGAAPTEGAWSEGYQFSEQPQTAAEQVLLDNYPQLWEVGVRSVATEATIALGHSEETSMFVPAPLVQYVNGVRYEGTPTLPLGFLDRDPMEPPVAAIEAFINYVRTGEINVYDSDTAPRYRIETDSNRVVTLSGMLQGNDAFIGNDNSVRNWENGLNVVLAGDAIRDQDVPEGQNRALYPGEMVITVHDSDTLTSGVFDPRDSRIYWEDGTDTLFVPGPIQDENGDYSIPYEVPDWVFHVDPSLSPTRAS